GKIRRPPRHHGRREAAVHFGSERPRAMKARDLTDLALRNLREALFRNALTTLGVAVGVASLVAMLSLGVGLQELASKRLSQSGLFDTILVTAKNSFRGVGRPQRQEQQPDKPVRVLDEDARKKTNRFS